MKSKEESKKRKKKSTILLRIGRNYLGRVQMNHLKALTKEKKKKWMKKVSWTQLSTQTR